MNPGALQMLAIPLIIGLMLGTVAVLLPLAVALLAVINDTANGMDEVASWPDWNPFDWLAPAMFVPAAAIVAGLPGFCISAALLAIGLDPVVGAFAAGVPVVASWTVLLPIVLYSMLAENSILSAISPHTLRSFRTVGEAWMLFYMYSFVIGLFAALGASMLGVRGLVVSSLGAVCS